MSSFLNAVGGFVILVLTAAIWVGLIYLAARILLCHVQGWATRIVVVAVALLMILSIAQNFVTALGGLFR